MPKASLCLAMAGASKNALKPTAKTTRKRAKKPRTRIYNTIIKTSIAKKSKKVNITYTKFIIINN